jgi:hypothetical protein
MLLKVVKSHNGKFGRVGTGELVNYDDPRYCEQLIRMGIAEHYTAPIQTPNPAPIYEVKTPPKRKTKDK